MKAKKKDRKKQVHVKEIESLAKLISQSFKMLLPRVDYGKKIIINGKDCCIPHGGLVGSYAFCSDCFYQKCCQKETQNEKK